MLSRILPKDEDTLLENIENEVNSQSSDPGDIPIAKKLQLAIDASLRVPDKQIHPKKTLSSILKFELTIAEQTGKRGHFLEMIYQMLLTVPPTSVEAERVFSSSAYLCNRFRTRLGDATLDNLCFIRNNQPSINNT